MDSILVCEKVENATCTLVVLLDVSKMDQYLAHVNNNPGSILYFADAKGLPLSIGKNAEIYRVAASGGILPELQKAVGTLAFNKTVNRTNYLVTQSDIGVLGIKLVSIIPEEELLARLKYIKSFISISWLLCTISGLIFYITRWAPFILKS